MDEWRRAVVNALGSAMLLPRVDVTDVGVDCTSEMDVFSVRTYLVCGRCVDGVCRLQTWSC